MYLGNHYVNVLTLDLSSGLSEDELVVNAKDYDGLFLDGQVQIGTDSSGNPQYGYVKTESMSHIEGTKDLLITVSLGGNDYQVIVQNYFKDNSGRAAANSDFVYADSDREYYQRLGEYDLIYLSPDTLKISGKKVTGTDFNDSIDFVLNEKLKNIKNAKVYLGKGDDEVRLNDNGATVYAGDGEKGISLGKGNDTIYFDDGSAGYVNMDVLGEKDTIDTIYSSEDSSLGLSTESLDKGDVSFKLDKNDLVLEYGENNKVVLKDELKNIGLRSDYSDNSLYFEFDDGGMNTTDIVNELKSVYNERYGESLGNSSSKKAQKIQGTIFDEDINTGKGADKVTLYGGDHYVATGKGNDKLELKNAYTDFGVNKGDGNDTIELDENSKVTIILDDSHPDLSFEMKGDDLIMTVTHEKLKGEKKAVSEKITIKDYLSIDESSKDVNISLNGPTRSLNELLREYEVVRKGSANKNNYLRGTEGNDIFYGGNKCDVFTDYEESNDTYYMGKGSTVVMDEDGDDKYVANINSQVAIVDGNGDNTLQINGVKASDLHLHFDMDQSGNISPVENHDTPPTPYTFMTSSQVNKNVSKNTFANPYTLKYGKMSIEEYDERGRYGLIDEDDVDYSKVTYKNNVDGISVALPVFESIMVADNKGKNVSEIAMLTLGLAHQSTTAAGREYLQTVVSSLGDMFDSLASDLGMLPEYLVQMNDYVSEGSVTTQVLLTEADAILATSSKGMSKDEKRLLAYSKQIAKAIKSDIASIYNSVNMGSESNDTYTKVKGLESKFLQIVEADNLAHGMPKAYTQMTKYIISGAGSDTYNFAKDIGRVMIASGNVSPMSMHGDASSTPSMSSDRDTLVFSNYSLENGTLCLNEDSGKTDGNGPSISFDAFDMSKIKGKNPTSPYMGTVSYWGLTDTYSPAEDVYVPYQAQSLTVQDKKRSYDVNFVSNNSVNLGKDNKNHIALIDGAQVYLGKGYNFVTSSSVGSNDIYYGGGKDIYTLYGESNDFYNVDFNKNTLLGICDTYGDDVMHLKGNAHDMRLFFDYDIEDGDVYSLRIMDKSNMSAKNLSSENYNGNGLSQDAVKSGLYVDGTIETWTLNGENLNIDNWVGEISSQVSSWLSENGFSSTYEVFEDGSKAQIADLIAQYNKYDAAEYV